MSMEWYKHLTCFLDVERIEIKLIFSKKYAVFQSWYILSFPKTPPSFWNAVYSHTPSFANRRSRCFLCAPFWSDGRTHARHWQGTTTLSSLQQNSSPHTNVVVTNWHYDCSQISTIKRGAAFGLSGILETCKCTRCVNRSRVWDS